MRNFDIFFFIITGTVYIVFKGANLYTDTFYQSEFDFKQNCINHKKVVVDPSILLMENRSGRHLLMWNERNLFIFNKHSLEETDASPVQNTVELTGSPPLHAPSLVKTLSYILSIRMLLFGSEL